MATPTETPQSEEAQIELPVDMEMIMSPVDVPETRGRWLFNIDVRVFMGDRVVGLCRAKLIKESEYDSRTKHFFSAMDDQSNTMGDLAQLVLWSEGRWVFEGPWEGMKEYGDKIPVREQLDEEVRENGGKLSIRKYCDPVLYRPSEKDPIEPLPFPAGRHWLLLFTNITIENEYRRRNIDSAMVRMALNNVREVARNARRPLLAAVEPGCVQLKRFYVSDRPKFEEWYGSLWRHWPVVQAIKARQEKFWLEMGFQKFEKPEFNRDLSNFFFWSGLFELPESKTIDLNDLGKQPEGLEDVAADGHMIVPEKRDARYVKPKRKTGPEQEQQTEQEHEPEQEQEPGQEQELEQQQENEHEQEYEPQEQDNSDKMDLDDVSEAAADQRRPGKRDRTEDDEDETAVADQRPGKRYRLADDMNVDPVELPQWFEATDQIGDGDMFDVINWAEYDSD